MTLHLPGMETEYRDLSKSQWYTPPWLADRLWDWWLEQHAQGGRGWDQLYVLEPAAGNGSLIRPALASGRVAAAAAIDIDERNVRALRTLKGRYPDLMVTHGDFLALAHNGSSFHVCLMNPPYENGQDVDFILRAFVWTRCVVGIFRSAIVHGDERYERLWRHVDLVRGKWLRRRPVFGKGQKGDSALSDFVVLELAQRDRPREENEDLTVSLGWW